ncbi:hypothetical protein CapIbe_001392 [Capra ibex]
MCFFPVPWRPALANTGSPGSCGGWTPAATHSSILSWRIPWTEDPGGLSPQGHRHLYTTEVTEHSHMQETVDDVR